MSHWRQRRTLYGRGWENSIACSTTRKGSLSANYKMNADANTRDYDVNQKTMQALDTLAEECGAFEVTMKKVAREHEEGDVLSAMATDLAEELDRAHKEQERL